MMNFNQLLNQVLNVAKNSMEQAKSGNADTLTKVGGGAALAGVLSMILGRSGGANLAKLGSLAVLGNLAYKAYQEYRQNRPQTDDLAQSAFDPANLTQNQDANVIILRAMIAAAASDGEISADERAMIEKEAGSDPQTAQWIAQELAQVQTPAQIASQVAGNQALAANVYLAARMVCQTLSRKEIIFLADLAKALNLDDQFVEELEKQAGF